MIDNNIMYKEIQEIAYRLFREWKKNALTVYQELSFDIKDESIIVVDVLSSIQRSVFCLLKKEHSKRIFQFYDYGFILGFIQGNLNTVWFRKYIYMQSTPNKKLKMLEALILYFKLKNFETYTVDEFYEKLVEKSSNIYDLNKNFIYTKDEKEQEIFNESDFYSESYVIQFLLEEYKLQVKTPINYDENYYLPSLINFISMDTVYKWIKYIPIDNLE